MSPEVERQFRDDLARVRHERDAYAKRATDRRNEGIKLRQKRDFLGALIADGRAREYRQIRDQYAAEVRRLSTLIRPVKSEV